MSSDSEKDAEQRSVDGSSVPPLLQDDSVSVDSSGNAKGTRMYKYVDYSNVAEGDDEFVDQAPDQAPVNGRAGHETSIRVQKFPVKLYAILATKEFNDIITWMPHGRSWKVLKPNIFESLVMPLFFEYSNYHSFNRLVNAWSFRRISKGPDRGSYYHELFLRGKPHLQKYMRRLPKTHKKVPMKKEDEPDFYALDKANPLPPLDSDAANIPGVSMDMRRPIPQAAHRLHGGPPGSLLTAGHVGHGVENPHAVTPPHMTPPRTPGGPQTSAVAARVYPTYPSVEAMHHHHGGYGGPLSHFGAPPGAYIADEFEASMMRSMQPPSHLSPVPTYAGGLPPLAAHHSAAVALQGNAMLRQRPVPVHMDQVYVTTSPPMTSQHLSENDQYYFYQQQQMNHMYQLQQMRMYERQQAQMGPMGVLGAVASALPGMDEYPVQRFPTAAVAQGRN